MGGIVGVEKWHNFFGLISSGSWKKNMVGPCSVVTMSTADAELGL